VGSEGLSVDLSWMNGIAVVVVKPSLREADDSNFLGKIGPLQHDLAVARGSYSNPGPREWEVLPSALEFVTHESGLEMGLRPVEHELTQEQAASTAERARGAREEELAIDTDILASGGLQDLDVGNVREEVNPTQWSVRDGDGVTANGDSRSQFQRVSVLGHQRDTGTLPLPGLHGEESSKILH